MKKIAKNKGKKAAKKVSKEVKSKLTKKGARARRINEEIQNQVAEVKSPHLANTKGVHKLLEQYIKIHKFKVPEVNLSNEVEVFASDLPKIPNEGTVLNIYAWNVNGFRAILKKGKFHEFLEKEKPDILCLGETKIDEEKLKAAEINKLLTEKYNYAGFWNCCRIKKGYSGVAILTRYKPMNVFRGINVFEHDQEGRSITLEFPTFYIVSVYAPNSGGRIDYRANRWDVDFQKYVRELKNKKDVIVCGDLNVAHNPIDLTHPKSNEGGACYTIEERTGLTNFLNAGFIDTFRHLNPDTIKYSYFSQRLKSNYEKNVGWRLDYFVINSDAAHRLINSDILKHYVGSDHVPIKLNWRI